MFNIIILAMFFLMYEFACISSAFKILLCLLSGRREYLYRFADFSKNREHFHSFGLLLEKYAE